MILALDVAGLMGVAEGIPGNCPQLSTVKLVWPDDDGPDPAFGRIVLWMAERLRDDPPSAIYVENPIPYGVLNGPRTTSRTTHLLNGLVDCAIGVARARRVPIRRVAVSTVRQMVIGEGRLPGESAKRLVLGICRAAGLDPADDNESDAWAVWMWACSVVPTRAMAPNRHQTQDIVTPA